MKLKKMWYILIPAMILMAAVKAYQKFVEYTGVSIIGESNLFASYAAIGIVAVMFVILLIMTLKNRETAPVYNIRKNIPAGAMCLFAASVTVIDIGCYLPSIFLYGTFSFSVILNLMFSALAAAGLFMLSWIHVSSRKPPVPIALYLLTIPLWSLVKLLTILMKNSANSIVMADVLELFVYLFLSLYMFSAVSVVCAVKSKNPVKRIPLYGMPLMALLFTYDVSVIMRLILVGYTRGYYTTILCGAELTLFALYIFFFTREVTRFSQNKDDVTIIENEEQLRSLFEKRREENLREFEKARDKERARGNYYILEENAYAADIPGMDDKYGYAKRGYANDSYVNEMDDTPIVMGTDNDDDNGDYSTPPENIVAVSKEDTGEDLSRIDALIMEITAGENDLDRP